MIGVVAFLLEKFNYQVYISLEDLSKPFSDKIVSGISGVSVKDPAELSNLIVDLMVK